MALLWSQNDSFAPFFTGGATEVQRLSDLLKVYICAASPAPKKEQRMDQMLQRPWNTKGTDWLINNVFLEFLLKSSQTITYWIVLESSRGTSIPLSKRSKTQSLQVYQLYKLIKLDWSGERGYKRTEECEGKE